MSIWQDIQKSGLKPIKELTQKDFRDFMVDLQVQAAKDAEERQWHVHTGEGGMRMINDAMQTQVYLKLMKDLNFSKEERKRLGELIKSPDKENFEIAKIIIDKKLEETEEIREYGNSKK